MTKKASGIPERLHQILTAEGISNNRFAKRSGLSSQSIGQYINGKRVPDAKAIQKIVKACPHINPFWFLLGEGEMYTGRDTSSSETISEDTIPYHIKRPPTIDPSNKVRKRIRKIMEENNYNDLSTLSEKTGLPETTLKSQVYGSGKITLEVLIAICKLIPAISWHWLLTGDPKTYSVNEYTLPLLDKLNQAYNKNCEQAREIEQLKHQLTQQKTKND